MLILSPFPDPGEDLAALLRLLHVAHTGTAQDKAEAEAEARKADPHLDLTALATPWLPDTCPADTRRDIWTWCDQVAAWLNHEYAWRTADLIPPCWPRHPHIAREIPVLAVLRWRAQLSPGPDLLEDWHRNALPAFSDRLRTRLGDTSNCRTGTHQPWPAVSRSAAHAHPDAEADRAAAFDRDALNDTAPDHHRSPQLDRPTRSGG